MYVTLLKPKILDISDTANKRFYQVTNNLIFLVLNIKLRSIELIKSVILY